MEQSIEELRRLIAEMHRTQRPSGPSPYLMVLIGMAVPVILGLLSGGRLMSEIENNDAWLQRQEAHLIAIDAKVSMLEQHQAVILSVLDAQLNSLRAPFQDVPTSPPPTSPTLRRH